MDEDDIAKYAPDGDEAAAYDNCFQEREAQERESDPYERDGQDE